MATNSFNQEHRYLFEDCWTCWYCNMNTATAQHHIMGRGNSSSKVESSLLNCAWLCNYKCHIQIHGQLQSEENRKMLLQKTRAFLKESKYPLNELDREFLKKYKQYYE